MLIMTIEELRAQFPNENWSVVEDYRNYFVSDIGNVFSLNRESILKPYLVRSGYLQVRLYHHINGARDRKIHRLVAKAFITNPEDKRTVNHLDGNKENNTISNLEWATDSENILHAYRTGLMTGNSGSMNGMSKAVVKIDRETRSIVDRFDSARLAGASMHIDSSGITMVCNKSMYHFHGFYWMWKEDMIINGIPNPIPTKKLRGKRVVQLNNEEEIIATFRSCAEAARETGFLRSKISAVCNGKNKTSGGYKWKFVEA